MIDIKYCVKYPVKFSHYRASQLFYTTVNGDVFPVDISDVGDATFLREDKGLLFMRYMRKYNKNLEQGV